MAGAILVVVASLSIAIVFVIVLLAQLYYSLLFRRRQLQSTSNTAGNYSSSGKLYHQACPQNSLGSLFFPPLHCKEYSFDAEKKQQLHLHHQHRIRIVGEAEHGGECSGVGDAHVYISNPMYDAAAGQQPSRAETPFDTPESSPLR